MKNIVVINNEVKKDKSGNGIFEFEAVKTKIFSSKVNYKCLIKRDEENQICYCDLIKSIDGRNESFIFNLSVPSSKEEMKMNYRHEKNGSIEEFDLMKDEIAFTVAKRKEQVEVLNEFDKVMWVETNFGGARAIIIDIITDVLDITERDDAEGSDKLLTDFELIHSTYTDFFKNIAETDEKIEM